MSAEKQGLETGALTQFSEALASKIGTGRFAFKELRDPPEPDSLCSLDGKPLYVEVGHIYGTLSDVKKSLGRTGKSAASEEQKLLSRLTALDARLITPLNSLLESKATKTYSSSRVWLLIRSAFPMWSLEDFKAYQANIIVPEVHPFEQIWLLCGVQASAGILLLDCKELASPQRSKTDDQ